MIEYKTAVLIGAAMQMGAIVAGASSSCEEGIYNFGKYLGIAFQLQDDYLDAFGNPETFGKQVGGDIIANKKTFLYLTALKNSSVSEAEILSNHFKSAPENPSEKIKTVKQVFQKTGAAIATEKEIEHYTQKAISVLDVIKISEEKKNELNEFANWLMKRKV